MDLVLLDGGEGAQGERPWDALVDRSWGLLRSPSSTLTGFTNSTTLS